MLKTNQFANQTKLVFITLAAAVEAIVVHRSSATKNVVLTCVTKKDD